MTVSLEVYTACGSTNLFVGRRIEDVESISVVDVVPLDQCCLRGSDIFPQKSNRLFKDRCSVHCWRRGYCNGCHSLDRNDRWR